MSVSRTQSLPIRASAAIAAIVGILHYAISGIPRQFEDVYTGFGAELPWITSFVIDSPAFFWIGPVVVGGGIVLHHFEYISRVSAVLVAVLGTLASFAVLMVGLYYPIFLLGSVPATQ